MVEAYWPAILQNEYLQSTMNCIKLSFKNFQSLSQLLAEKIIKSISSAVYLSQHLLFSELTQRIKRTQKVNKDLTPSAIFLLIKNYNFK